MFYFYLLISANETKTRGQYVCAIFCFVLFSKTISFSLAIIPKMHDEMT